MTPDEDAVRRSAETERALKVLDPAFDAMMQGVSEELFATSPIHTDKILRLQAMGQAISAARKALREVVIEGENAKAAIAATGMTRTGIRRD